MTEQYNGWTNYATWRVKLEMLDDDGIWREMTHKSIFELSEYLKEYCEGIIDEYDHEIGTGVNLAVSYAHAFLDEVNWREIAEHIAEDYPEIIRSEQHASSK